jgi:hypothetical protein
MGVPQPEEGSPVGVREVTAITRWAEKAVGEEREISLLFDALQLARDAVESAVRRVVGGHLVAPCSGAWRREPHTPRPPPMPERQSPNDLTVGAREGGQRLDVAVWVGVAQFTVEGELHRPPLRNDVHDGLSVEMLPARIAHADWGQKQPESFGSCRRAVLPRTTRAERVRTNRPRHVIPIRISAVQSSH